MFRCAFLRLFKMCSFKSFRDDFPQCFIPINPRNRSEAPKPVEKAFIVPFIYFFFFEGICV